MVCKNEKVENVVVRDLWLRFWICLRKAKRKILQSKWMWLRWSNWRYIIHKGRKWDAGGVGVVGENSDLFLFFCSLLGLKIRSRRCVCQHPFNLEWAFDNSNHTDLLEQDFSPIARTLCWIVLVDTSMGITPHTGKFEEGYLIRGLSKHKLNLVWAQGWTIFFDSGPNQHHPKSHPHCAAARPSLQDPLLSC